MRIYFVWISRKQCILFQNFQSLKYKSYRCASILIIVISDIIYNLAHFYLSGSPIISWGAHAVGAIGGFILGLICYKSRDKKEQSKNRINLLFWSGIVLFGFVIVVLSLISFQIKKCTKSNDMYSKYVYVC